MEAGAIVALATCLAFLLFRSDGTAEPVGVRENACEVRAHASHDHDCRPSRRVETVFRIAREQA
jgi:hypothetical protein